MRITVCCYRKFCERSHTNVMGTWCRRQKDGGCVLPWAHSDSVGSSKCVTTARACRVGRGRLRSASVALQSCREGKKGPFVRRHNFPFSQKPQWKIRVTQLAETLSFSHQSTRGRKKTELWVNTEAESFIFQRLLNKRGCERQWWSEV